MRRRIDPENNIALIFVVLRVLASGAALDDGGQWGLGQTPAGAQRGRIFRGKD